MESEEIKSAMNHLKEAITGNTINKWQTIKDIEKVAFQKPVNWPCNTRELRLDQVDKAIGDFQKYPNYASRERLVSLSFDYDANQLGSIGDMPGVSPYEIALVQNIYQAGFFHNIWSLRIFALRVVAEWVRMDRMVSRLEGYLKSQGAKVPYKALDWFRYLRLNFQLLYTAIDNYQDAKDECTLMNELISKNGLKKSTIKRLSHLEKLIAELNKDLHIKGKVDLKYNEHYRKQISKKLTDKKDN